MEGFIKDEYLIAFEKEILENGSIKVFLSSDLGFPLLIMLLLAMPIAKQLDQGENRELTNGDSRA